MKRAGEIALEYTLIIALVAAAAFLAAINIAQAIEARRAATGNTDAVADESASPEGCAQKGSL
jgi:hypothetical protein